MAVPPLQALVASGWDVALVVTGADTRRGPGERDLAQPGEGGGARAGAARSSHRSRRCSTSVPTSASWWPTAGWSGAPSSSASPWSTSTSRSCPAGGARPRSSGRSWPATRETGVCLMQLEEGLDTGPVFARPPGAHRTPVRRPTPLRRQLVEVGSELLVHDPRRRAARPDAPGGRGDLRREADAGRPASSTGAPAADAIDRVVRVGGAWTTWRGRRLKVLDAEPADAATGGPAVDRGPAPGTLGRRRGGHRRRAGCASSPSSRRASRRWPPRPGAHGAHPGRRTGWGA